MAGAFAAKVALLAAGLALVTYVPLPKLAREFVYSECRPEECAVAFPVPPAGQHVSIMIMLVRTACREAPFADLLTAAPPLPCSSGHLLHPQFRNGRTGSAHQRPAGWVAPWGGPCVWRGHAVRLHHPACAGECWLSVVMIAVIYT